MKDQIINIDETEIMDKYHLSHLTSKLIMASQLDDEKIQDLLYGNDYLTPSQDECVKQAKQMIEQAKNNHEKVFIAGDYDCDGICATAIMKYSLDSLMIENGYYIPDRFKDGYGLNTNVVKQALDKGYTLFITVDNGVKCFDAIEMIHQNGAKIIVSDHHRIEEEVNADVVVHPNFMEEPYSNLCGAGVALQISRALIGNNPQLTALAAVASIGDAMPLWKETRCLVKEGLKVIENGQIPSINAMIYEGSSIDKETIAFQVVPKINAVGRMGGKFNANTLVPFLLSRNISVVQDYVTQLNGVNNQRKNLSKKMVDKATSMIQEDQQGLLIYDDSFHQGLCGLVAGKIASEYQKPTLVFSKAEGIYKGSGRSVEGFNLFEFLSTNFDEFEAFGGHAFAVGLSIKEDDFPTFEQKFFDKMSEVDLPNVPESITGIEISSDLITLEEVSSLMSLEPYPSEMIEPNFALIKPKVKAFYELPKITKYSFANSTTGFEGILFPYRKIKALQNPDVIVGKLKLNQWNHQLTCQMNIEDME